MADFVLGDISSVIAYLVPSLKEIWGLLCGGPLREAIAVIICYNAWALICSGYYYNFLLKVPFDFFQLQHFFKVFWTLYIYIFIFLYFCLKDIRKRECKPHSVARIVGIFDQFVAAID